MNSDILNPVEHQAGVVLGVHKIGREIELFSENLNEDIQKLEVSLRTQKDVLNMFNEYKIRLSTDKSAGKLHLKEGEYAIKHVNIMIKMLLDDINTTIRNIDNSKAMLKISQKLLNLTKNIHDNEKIKHDRFVEYENDENRSLKNRPVGYPIGIQIKDKE